MAQRDLDKKFTDSLTRSGVGQSAGFLIPGWINELGLIINPNGNTAGVEFCMDDDSVADGSCTWVAWDAGPVTVLTARAAVGPLTRVRINQTVGAGVSTLFICGQRRLP